jgi:hypothetical protein
LTDTCTDEKGPELAMATAASPDGNIVARVEGPDDIEVRFRPGAFDRYGEEELAHQIERLAQLCWVAFDRERTEKYRQALRLSNEEVAQAEAFPPDERRRHYDEDLNAVRASGTAPSGLLRIQSEALLRWRVQLAPGALRQLNEEQFVAELHAAVRSLFADRMVQITVIKSRYYDLGIPRAWRDMLNNLAEANRAASNQAQVNQLGATRSGVLGRR